MKRILFALLLLSCSVRAEWTPPEKPAPATILQEADADTRAGRFEDALAKHLWFHENALKFEASQYGVRLSFALMSWMKLGAKYPPALQALQDVREGAEAEVRSPEGSFESFHDAIALNRTLGERGRSVKLFQWMDANKPEYAKRAFSTAESSLIEAKEYRLCGKYLTPEADLALLVGIFRQHLGMAKDERFASLGSVSEKSFTAGTATLVALLVLNDRKDEAKVIRDKAGKEWDDKQFQKTLDEALNGQLPMPFPAR